MELMGISQEGVGQIQSEIRNYKEGIIVPLNEIAEKAEYASAFKGSNIAENMRLYLEAVIGKITNMLNYIDEFDSSLNVIAMNYETQASSVSTDVTAAAASVVGTEIYTTTGVKGYVDSHRGPAAYPGVTIGIDVPANDSASINDVTPNLEEIKTVDGPVLQDIKSVTADGVVSADANLNPNMNIKEQQIEAPFNPINQSTGNFNNNGIDTSRIANSEYNAANDIFISQDKVYSPSFESPGVTFTNTGTDGVTRIDNNGVPIGFTDTIQGDTQN